MGRKMVWRVEVRMTAERVLRLASASSTAPSSESSFSMPGVFCQYQSVVVNTESNMKELERRK